MAETRTNRSAGPAPRHCAVAGLHQDDNTAGPRNVLAAVLASRRKANASGQNGADAAYILAAAGVALPQLPADAFTVNFVRRAGPDKNKARACEAIARQVLVAPRARVEGGTGNG